jgi:hypothetical protein
VVIGDYRDLFVVIATAAATLIGLLFVAMSVSKDRAKAHPQVIREFRAAAALFAFTNPFAVSLFGLVPGTNIGYPAAIVGVIGMAFTAAGVRTTLSLPSRQQYLRPQAMLILALLFIFGVQLVVGIGLIVGPHRSGDLATIGYVLVASLLVGIGRAWELVGDWDTGLFSSIGLLIGHHSQAQVATDQKLTVPSDAPTPIRDRDQ